MYFLAILELTKRTDLVCLLLSKFFKSFDDTVCYEVPLFNHHKKELVFSIILKKYTGKLKHYEDLSRLKEFPLADSNYIVLCKTDLILSRIFTKELQNSLNSCKTSLKMLYISSKISMVSNSNLLIRATFEYSKKQTANQHKFLFTTIEKVLEYTC